MSRAYNFSAGPAVLPEEVLREAAEEMLDYKGCGMSVMEMSHRSKVFQEIIDEAEADLRDLLQIPDNYKVLFLQGGASQQFAMIPMNLMKNGVADYIVTGQWAKKAWQEAQKYGTLELAKIENMQMQHDDLAAGGNGSVGGILRANPFPFHDTIQIHGVMADGGPTVDFDMTAGGDGQPVGLGVRA